MLTEKDLAIVRAALHFLDEEFSPNEDELFQHYLDDEGILAGVSTALIKKTREKFESATLYTAFKRLDREELVTNKLTRAYADDSVSRLGDREVPVSVIVTAR